MTAIVTHGFIAPSTAGGGGGGGPSGTVVVFVLYNSDGDPESSVDLSGAGEVKVSINGASYAAALGATPTGVTGRTGHYVYEFDETELVPGQRTYFSVVKAGYHSVLEHVDVPDYSGIITSVNNAIVAIESVISGEIADAITTINTNTDEDTDALPTAAEIDTQLTGTHGAGAWTGASASAIRDEIMQHEFDTDRTVDGFFKRADAVLCNKATGMNGPHARFYMQDGTTVAVQADLDVEAGTRGIPDVSETEEE